MHCLPQKIFKQGVYGRDLIFKRTPISFIVADLHFCCSAPPLIPRQRLLMVLRSVCLLQCVSFCFAESSGGGSQKLDPKIDTQNPLGGGGGWVGAPGLCYFGNMGCLQTAANSHRVRISYLFILENSNLSVGKICIFVCLEGVLQSDFLVLSTFCLFLGNFCFPQLFFLHLDFDTAERIHCLSRLFLVPFAKGCCDGCCVFSQCYHPEAHGVETGGSRATVEAPLLCCLALPSLSRQPWRS